MAPKGLGHSQGSPWGLLGSEAADWLGSRIFLLRTAGLYRALDLEEIGEKSLYLPPMVLREAFYELQAPHAGLLSLCSAPTSRVAWPLPEVPSEVLQQPGFSLRASTPTLSPQRHGHAHPLPLACSPQSGTTRLSKPPAPLGELQESQLCDPFHGPPHRVTK